MRDFHSFPWHYSPVFQAAPISHLYYHIFSQPSPLPRNSPVLSLYHILFRHTCRRSMVGRVSCLSFMDVLLISAFYVPFTTIYQSSLHCKPPHTCTCCFPFPQYPHVLPLLWNIPQAPRELCLYQLHCRHFYSAPYTRFTTLISAIYLSCITSHIGCPKPAKLPALSPVYKRYSFRLQRILSRTHIPAVQYPCPSFEDISRRWHMSHTSFPPRFASLLLTSDPHFRQLSLCNLFIRTSLTGRFIYRIISPLYPLHLPPAAFHHLRFLAFSPFITITPSISCYP